MEITIQVRRADHPDAGALLDAYFAELVKRLGEFDAGRSVSATPDEMSPPNGCFLVAYGDGAPLACGGLKRLGVESGELKRMFVKPEARRLGLGRTLLGALEAAAAENGWPRLFLDTASPLEEARALYRRAGYCAIAPYNDNPYASAWFYRDLGSDFGFAHARHPRLWQGVFPSVDNRDLSHDRHHLRRVYAWCLRLAPEAGADPDLAGAAALVHDLDALPKDDPGRASSGEHSARSARAPLAEAGYSEKDIALVAEAVRRSPWSAGHRAETPLQRLLQDADRLDALGAVGLGRALCCAQGLASRGRLLRLWDPDDPLGHTGRALDEIGNMLDHVLHKLMRLGDGLHLPASRAEAARRRRLLEVFLDEVERETLGIARPGRGAHDA